MWVGFDLVALCSLCSDTFIALSQLLDTPQSTPTLLFIMIDSPVRTLYDRFMTQSNYNNCTWATEG
jgi:hypothetical protein